MGDGGVAVGSYADLGPDRSQPVDRNPTLCCEICGDAHSWMDYWKDRVLDGSGRSDVPLWCVECEDEIQRMRRRLSMNRSLDEWGGADA
ncbi:hypothetical protein [Halorubrum salinum]|uniref:hypothetical protein n=1 Tax=Halorubrum salinum TaxID=767517 RepID=UPI00211274F0|nr:hypothetical protein [Halorubrum salinum]